MNLWVNRKNETKLVFYYIYFYVGQKAQSRIDLLRVPSWYTDEEIYNEARDCLDMHYDSYNVASFDWHDVSEEQERAIREMLN